MKCYEHYKNNKNYCKKHSCRYWIENKENKNCTIIAANKKSNMTLEDIGKIFNVTRMRICQIEKRAIKKIKNILLSNNIL